MAHITERLRRMPELAESMGPDWKQNTRGVGHRGMVALVNPYAAQGIVARPA